MLRPHLDGLGDHLGFDEVGQPHPDAGEAVDLLDEQRIVGLQGPRDDVELAMAPDSLTGLLSWLEAAPPGMRYRPSPTSPE